MKDGLIHQLIRKVRNEAARVPFNDRSHRLPLTDIFHQSVGMVSSYFRPMQSVQTS